MKWRGKLFDGAAKECDTTNRGKSKGDEFDLANRLVKFNGRTDRSGRTVCNTCYFSFPPLREVPIQLPGGVTLTHPWN